MTGILKSLGHGTNQAALQIYSSVSLFFNYSELKNKYLVPGNVVSNYCASLESKSRLKTQKINNSVTYKRKIKTKSNVVKYLKDGVFHVGEILTYYILIELDVPIGLSWTSVLKKRKSGRLPDFGSKNGSLGNCQTSEVSLGNCQTLKVKKCKSGQKSGKYPPAR
ncbi:hypothetical protein TSAR_012874, partial [Trichomalopsis sarcophagae]